MMPSESPALASTPNATLILRYAGQPGIRRPAGAPCCLALLGSLFCSSQFVNHAIDIIFVRGSRGGDVTTSRFILGMLSIGIALLLTAFHLRNCIRRRLSNGRAAESLFAALGVVIAVGWWAMMFFMHSLLMRWGID